MTTANLTNLRMAAIRDKWRKAISPLERRLLAARYTSIVIDGEPWEAFRLPDDPDWPGLRRYRLETGAVVHEVAE